MIDPDMFGCSGKLSYNQTRALIAANSGAVSTGDYSELKVAGRIVASVDRVHRCAKDWDLFARIALNHAFADVVCAGGVPLQALLSFEFGIECGHHEWIECSKSFHRELLSRGVSLGKCHSSHGLGVTAVTVATVARAPTAAPPSLRQGAIYISRPIGAMKLLYLTEMGVEVDSGQSRELLKESPSEEFLAHPWNLVTDVSGHGLLGAVAQVATSHGLRVDLELSPTLALTPDVLNVPVECLQNAITSYGFEIPVEDEAALVLATLRETAGPFLGFVDEGGVGPVEGKGQPRGIYVGRYRSGGEGVGISWVE